MAWAVSDRWYSEGKGGRTWAEPELEEGYVSYPIVISFSSLREIHISFRGSNEIFKILNFLNFRAVRRPCEKCWLMRTKVRVSEKAFTFLIQLLSFPAFLFSLPQKVTRPRATAATEQPRGSRHEAETFMEVKGKARRSRIPAGLILLSLCCSSLQPNMTLTDALAM